MADTPAPALPDDELVEEWRMAKTAPAGGRGVTAIADDMADRIATLSTLLSERDAEIERLREAGNALAKVGDDKLAFRSEWLQALTAWRALSRKDS